MKKNLLSIFAMAVLMVITSVGFAQTTYTKVTSDAGLEAGANYLIVAHYDDLGVLAMGYQQNNNRKAVVVSEDGESITLTPGEDPTIDTDVFQFTLGGNAGAWTLYDVAKGGYLYAASSSNNYLKTQTELDANGQWAITFNADGTALVVAQGENTRNYMRFNPNTQNQAPLFSCYGESSTVGAQVSFYKAGEAVIAPEPSNYPTDFAASVVGADVTLMWHDATGAQLPAKYLLMGSTTSINPPVDGIPVPNGELVANVAYGVGEVAFSGLTPNTTYNFAIFPYTNGGDDIDYKTDGNYPTVQVTIDEVAYLLDEDFESGLGMFTEYSVLGDKVWEQAEHNENHYAYMNGYFAGRDYEANEDWLISPEIPFNRDFGAIMLEFKSAKNFTGDNIRVMISSDFTGGDPSTDGYWEDITGKFHLSAGSYNWVESGRVNVLDVISNELGFFHFAFVYTCTTGAAAAWEIDDVKVIGGTVSVKEYEFTKVSVYPNPAHDMLSFNLESDAQVNIFDMTGRMVSSMSMTAGQGQYNVANLENGVYFLNIRYNDGKTAVARFVKF